jgi:uncharacterized protein (UPF0335 family)
MTDTDTTYRVTADELRQFIERFERLEAEKKDIADQQKEVMAEAKGRGYDTGVMRKIIALRKRDRDDIAEEEAVLEMYKEALGMAAWLERIGQGDRVVVTWPTATKASEKPSYRLAGGGGEISLLTWRRLKEDRDPCAEADPPIKD